MGVGAWVGGGGPFPGSPCFMRTTLRNEMKFSLLVYLVSGEQCLIRAARKPRFVLMYNNARARLSTQRLLYNPVERRGIM